RTPEDRHRARALASEKPGGGAGHLAHRLERKLFSLTRADQQQSISAKRPGAMNVNHIALLAAHFVGAEHFADDSARAFIQFLERAVARLLTFIDGHNEGVGLNVIKLTELCSYFHF